MNKTEDFFKKIEHNPVIAVLRAPDAQIGYECISACYRGGLKNIEVTLSTPDAVELLKRAKKDFPDLFLGFGTITNTDEAQRTSIPEADFIVSPHSDKNLFDFYHKQNVVYIPGGSTPSELMHIHSNHYAIQKLFPGSLYGPSGVKGILAPLPMLNLIVTGGVSLENAEQFLRAGARAVCVGGNLFNREWMSSSDIIDIEKEAAKWSLIS